MLLQGEVDDDFRRPAFIENEIDQVAVGVVTPDLDENLEFIARSRLDDDRADEIANRQFVA